MLDYGSKPYKKQRRIAVPTDGLHKQTISTNGARLIKHVFLECVFQCLLFSIAAAALSGDNKDNGKANAFKSLKSGFFSFLGP